MLRRETVDKIKDWVNKEKTPREVNKYDFLFVKILLLNIFGVAIMKISSVGGAQAHNADVRHQALDQLKVTFIRG